MAVKLRLMRMGKKKAPYYRVVVMDGRAPRDGRYIDLIGRYDPHQEPSVVEIDNDKAVEWLRRGAQPTETVAKLLEVSGAMARHKVAAGKIHTVGPAAEAPAERVEADAEEAAATEPVADTASAADSGDTAETVDEASGVAADTADEEE